MVVVGRRSRRPTDDEILARIKARKAERLKTRKAERQRSQLKSLQKVLRKLLGECMKPGKVYPMEDIEVFVEKSGRSFANAAPAMTYGVRGGYLDRVGRGQYRVTGKKMEGA
jgi:hypothetical protein